MIAASRTPVPEATGRSPGRSRTIPKKWYLITFVLMATIWPFFLMAAAGALFVHYWEVARVGWMVSGRSSRLESDRDVLLIAQEFVRLSVERPETARFLEELDEPEPSPRSSVRRTGPDSYQVKGWVDYQKRDGKKVRADYVCHLIYIGEGDDGDEWEPTSIRLEER